MIRSSSELTGGFSVRIENQGIPREKGIGGSAALCSSIAASILGCKYSCETISEEVLYFLLVYHSFCNASTSFPLKEKSSFMGHRRVWIAPCLVMVIAL